MQNSTQTVKRTQNFTHKYKDKKFDCWKQVLFTDKFKYNFLDMKDGPEFGKN